MKTITKSTILTPNQVFLRRKLTVVLPKGTTNNKKHVATLLKNIEHLGFTLSPDLISTLQTNGIEEILDFYEQIVPVLTQLVGAHVKYAPMYPNFPSQVMEMSDAELYINAQLHYLGNTLGLRIVPHTVELERFPIFQKIKARIIHLGTQEDFNTLFKNLLASKTSLSESDKEDLKWFIRHNRTNISDMIPGKIPNKENLSFVVNLLLVEGVGADIFYNLFKTATDILRLAVALSDGDISLAKKTKFINFKKNQRKMLLNLLNEIKHPLEDMMRYQEAWKRLGEKLHPGEYKDRYPNAFNWFTNIRSHNFKFEGFNSKVEKAILEQSLSVTNLLSKKPGEFARRLDKLLRTLENEPVIEAFEKVANQVSTPVLLQVMAHFKSRNENVNFRTFFPKGNVAKVQVIDNTLPKIDNTKRIVTICENALRYQYAKLEPLGKVYVDPKLKNYLIPFSNRSASKSFRTIVRGSKLPLPNKNLIRFFLWWKDMGEDSYSDRVDIDLSCVMYDTNWKYQGQCTYYNLKEYGITHSGDITSAPNGACEFIDVDIEKAKERNVRYILMSLNSFTHQKFSEMPECFAGWMSREDGQFGEIFDARTVQDKFDLTSETEIAVPLIIDVVDNKVIWTDLALKKNMQFENNVRRNGKSIALMAEAISNLHKANLFELFSLHAQARGEVVTNKKEADIIFSSNEGITPFDSEKIVGEYL